MVCCIPVRLVACLTLCLFASHAMSDEKETGSSSKALAFKMDSLEGKPVELKQYAGKVVLIVNVASECGLTDQYEGLQKIYDKYKEKGLVVLGFPCNQFGTQEPGSSQEISAFCKKNYGVTFDMFQKVNVNDVNNDKACDLYRFLTSVDAKPKGKGKVSWNFEKFLLNRQGEVVARFTPPTTPEDATVVAAIEKELATK
jgi:glutathione peroxidase